MQAALHGDSEGRLVADVVGPADPRQVVRRSRGRPGLRAVLLDVFVPAPGESARNCLLGNTTVELSSPGGRNEAALRIIRGGFAVEDAFRRVLIRARADGELPAGGEVAAQATYLLVLVHGLHVVARSEPDPARLADAVDAGLAALRPHF